MFKLRAPGDKTFLFDTEREVVETAFVQLLSRIGNLGNIRNMTLQTSENITRTTRHTALRYSSIFVSPEQLQYLDAELIGKVVQQMRDHDWSKPMDIAICRTETDPESGKRIGCMSKCVIKRVGKS